MGRKNPLNMNRLFQIVRSLVVILVSKQAFIYDYTNCG